MRTVWPVCGALLILAMTASAEIPLEGRVLDPKCSGVPNLVVKFLPPKAANLAEVVTVTGQNGAFRAELPASGDYYVSVYQGPQQLYGRVASLGENSPLTIVLKGGESANANSCGETAGAAPPTAATATTLHLDQGAIDYGLKLGKRWAQKNKKPGQMNLGNYQDLIVHLRPSIDMNATYITDRSLVALAEMRAQRMGKDLTADELRTIPANGLFNVLVQVDTEQSSEQFVSTYLGHSARAELRFKSRTLKALDLGSAASPAHAEWVYIADLLGSLGEPIGQPTDETVQVGLKTRVYLKFSFPFAEARSKDDQVDDTPKFVLINNQGREDKLNILTWQVQ